MLATVTDKKVGQDTSSDGMADYYMARVETATLYYDFGWQLPGRQVNPNEARNTFNGKELDREWGIQNYGFRMYDERVIRFISVDPLTKQYPELTPYQFASNSPIANIDLDGLERSNSTHSPSAGNVIDFGIAKALYKWMHPNNSPQEAEIATKDIKRTLFIWAGANQPASALETQLDIEFYPNSRLHRDGPVSNAVRHGYGLAAASILYGSDIAKQYANAHEFNDVGQLIIPGDYPHIWIDGKETKQTAWEAVKTNNLVFIPDGLDDSFVDKLNNDVALKIGAVSDLKNLDVNILQGVLDGKFYGSYSNHPLAPTDDKGNKLMSIEPLRLSDEQRDRIKDVIKTKASGGTVENWEEGREAAKGGG